MRCRTTAFAPGRRLALVREPENEHDPNAVAVWDAERRLQAGYVPAEVAPELRGDEQAVSLWEFRDEDGRRIGLRVLLAPADAWIQEPRRMIHELPLEERPCTGTSRPSCRRCSRSIRATRCASSR